MLTLEHRFQFLDRCVAWGSIGAGPPMVLVHGFPWSSQSWRNIAPWLARTHTVYYFDMLGSGRSSMSAGQTLTETIQSDLLQLLIEHWQLDRPHMVGHDFGGLAVLRCHFVNGIEYSAMHLIDPVAILPSGSPLYSHVSQYEAAFSGLPAYAHEALFQAYIQQAAHYPLREEAKEVYAAPWRGDDGQASFYRHIAHSNINHIDAAQALYRSRQFPVHLIWGERDTFIPVERGERLHELLAADSLTRIVNAAHLVQEDAPEALVGILLEQL